MCLQTTKEDGEKHIKHLGFYFREILNVRFFFLCDVTNMESILLTFTGKGSESLSRIYIFDILILFHN